MNDSKKPEALRLADDLDAYHNRSEHKEAAAELRRLYEEVEALKAKLDELQLQLTRTKIGVEIDAAIAKAEGEQA